MLLKNYDIKSISVDDAKKAMIDIKLWGYDEYNADVCAQVSYDNSGFIVKFTVDESNPLAEKREHFAPVNEDSCVEFFVNFTPDSAKRYINFEVNAGGFMNASFRADRYDSIDLLLEEVESFNINAEVFDAYWTVEFKIGYDFIKKYYPDFDINNCQYILGNFQKCGDNTETEHYLSYFPIECENPDFHRPEYFQKMNVIH